MTALACLSLFFAAIPAFLFWRNLHLLRPLPQSATPFAEKISILIPARDEEENIAAALTAARRSGAHEILILDDASTDRTSQIVAKIAKIDSRVQLLHGEALPNDWCGKNFACAQLAAAAQGSLLLFVDADVRIAPNAATRIAGFLRASGAELVSGVPRQELGTFSEWLLVPLIHFVLLGFLPISRMRRLTSPSYGTACGQLMMADAASYRASGGHATIRHRIHEGLALARSFRAHGFGTDLFDATDVARCRMYRRNADVWRGFLKNTHEGLGAPGLIVPATLLLLVGQVMPFVLLAGARPLSPAVISLAAVAAICAIAPRLAGAKRFAQPIATALLHPLAIVALVGIQWFGLARLLARRPPRWKGRSYPTFPADATTVR